MTIYTIGHSNHQLKTFLGLLHKFEIQLLVDVRSNPYSKYNPHFTYGFLKERVIQEDIAYLYLGNTIGGKYSDSNVQFIDGGVDYSKVACLLKFINGIDHVIQVSNEHAHIVMMCAEKDPYFCHRFVLISHALSKKGIITHHILSEKGDTIQNDELEEKMRLEYGKNYSYDELYSHHNWVLFHR